MGTSAYSDNKEPRYTSGLLPLNVPAVWKNISGFLSEYNVLSQHENKFISDRVLELQDLRQTALIIEENFFNDFGITGPPRKRLEEFQRRLDTVFINSGIDNLIKQNFYKTFMADPSINSAIENNTVSATKALIEEHSEYLLSDELIMSATDKMGVIDRLNELLDNLVLNENNKENKIIAKIKVSNKGKERASHFSKMNNIGLSRYIVGTQLDEKTMKWKIDFSQDQGNDLLEIGRLDTGVRDKILALLDNKAHIENLNDRYSFRNYVNNIIRNNINAELLPYIEIELQKTKDYTLTRNENTLKGYVEEVCMNAAFSYLTQNNEKAKRILKRTLPTGSARDLETKQQIPIDMLLKNYGFQIKSWNLNGARHEEQNKMSAGNFVTSNLQLSENDILIKLFGTYQFNQWYSEGFDEMEGYLSDIMDPEITPLNEIFNSYLDRIIRLNKTFSTDIEGFTSKQMYSNTFYLVNGKLIPGSEILLAMINAFNNFKYDSSVLQLKIDKITNRTENSLPQIIEEKHRNISRYHMDIFDMANLVKINYTVIFDADKLIESAYKQIQSFKN